jgi:glycolate oxidase iron-sulfur subunit
MNDLQVLVEGLQALNADIAKCMRCGFCQNHCPMYGETRWEFDVSRGKIALLSNMAEKMLSDADALANRLDRCLLCGSCEAICPSATPAVDIFLRARALLAGYKGLSPAKKLIFRTLLPNPGLFDLSMKAGAVFQGLALRRVQHSAQNTVNAPLLAPIIGNRHMHSLPDRPVHATHRDLDTEPAPGAGKVAFFPGCVCDRLYTSVGEACLKVFRHHGLGVFFPSGLACCGMPSLASGDLRGFEKQVRQNLKALGGACFDYLITPCGSCTEAISTFWTRYGVFSQEEQEKLREIAGKTLDINAFIVDVLKVSPAAPAPDARIVTYHDPCHLKKSLHISRQPRELIRANPGFELREMSESDRCCGCGGSFNLFHYDVSRGIGQKKRDNIVQTGADIVATGCPACMMQLDDTLSRNGDPVQVRHSVELYAQGLA